MPNHTLLVCPSGSISGEFGRAIFLYFGKTRPSENTNGKSKMNEPYVCPTMLGTYRTHSQPEMSLSQVQGEGKDVQNTVYCHACFRTWLV